MLTGEVKMECDEVSNEMTFWMTVPKVSDATNAGCEVSPRGVYSYTNWGIPPTDKIMLETVLIINA